MTTTAVLPVAVTPPHSLEAEQSVLGAVLLSDRCLPGLRLEEGLRGEHFYRDRHRAIFEAMCALADRGASVDVLTVTVELEQAGVLEQVGGRAAVDELTGGVPGLGGVRRYAQIVCELWVKREQLSSAYAQQAAILNHDDEGYQEALQRAHAVVAGGVVDGYLGAGRLAEHVLAWLEEPEEPGLPFPAELSRVGRMVRLRAGHTVVLAAWPSGGKTSAGLRMAATAGFKGHRAIIWTNEDTEKELVAKHVQMVTGIPASVVTDKRVNDPRFKDAQAAIREVPFEIQPCHGRTAAQIATHIRTEAPAVAVVDHFHNLAQIGTVADVDESVRVLAAAAGQAGVLLVLCAQLNRNRLNGVCKPPPVLADLRGSAMFEAAANTILLVHRDEQEAEDSERGKLGQAVKLDTGSVNVAKNKVTGRTGVVRVMFDAERLRFVEEANGEDPGLGEVQEEWPF